MHRFLFAVSVLVLCGQPAFAASENSITVIQEDGSKVTIELEDPEYVLPGEAEPFEMPAATSPGEGHARRPAPPPVEEEVKAPVLEPQPYVDQIVAPEGVQKSGPMPAPKKSKSAKKEKLKHPLPPPVPQQKAAQRDLPPGAEIGERRASSIAFDHAPPSSDFTTTRQLYKDKPVYVVTFQTENGPYDVLIDAASGGLIVAGYVETHVEKETAPGHLPQGWKPYDPQPVGNNRTTRGNIPSEDN